MAESSSELPEQLILARQAGLLKTFFKLVALLTGIALLLIAFLPGFATSEDIREPFLRNLTTLFIIGALYLLVIRAHVLASIIGTITACGLIASYSVYQESPGNMQMMAVLLLPTCMGGFLPSRRQFWTVYALNMVLMLVTVWLVTEYRGVSLEYRSVVTLGLLMTLLALLVDTLSSSYRESLRTTFKQLQEIHRAEERIVKLDADLGEAISERLRAEHQRDQLEHTGRLALEIAGFASILIDQDKVVTTPGFMDRYGFGSTATRQRLIDCIHPEDRSRFKQLLGGANLSASGRIEAEFRVNRENAAWWLFVMEPINDDTLQGILVDVTSRVVEQQRQVARENKLQESQRLESLGVLAGAIAHDFNNLLHVIMLNADLAKRGLNPDSRSAASIDRLLKTVNRAAELCGELLAYSGRGELSLAPFDLEELVNEMRSLLKISTPKGVEILFESNGSHPVIQGDITQIRQVVMNLITNAGEAIGSRPGTINIRVSTIEITPEDLETGNYIEEIAPGSFSLIEVADNGCGMEKKTIKRIFDPFFTLKETGHGLGLSAVLGIVRGHGGTIEIRSSIGEGSTFRVLLPVSDEAPEPTRSEDESTEVSQQRELILFADDEPEIRALAMSVLEEIGYRIIEAGNGQEAIDLFKAHHEELGLVILDLIMPVKTGLEAYFEISEVDPDVPVVFSSGFNENEALDRLPARTRSAFLKKPYLASELKSFVKGILHG